MAQELNQAEYLKRYMSKDQQNSDKKKKKKKLKPTKDSKLRIIDDDIDLKNLHSSQSLHGEEEFEEDLPVVAEVVDERPKHVRDLEAYQNNRWKVMGQDKDDFTSLSYEVMREKEVLGKQKRIRHDSGSDQSHLRKSAAKKQRLGRSQRHDSDSENDSQKKEGSSSYRKRHDSDSDSSVPQKASSASNQKQSSMKEKTDGSNSDLSPLRSHEHRNKGNDSSARRRHDSGSDQSPARKRKHSDSDQSPVRRKGNSDSNQSPVRRRKDSDSDQSPVRRKNGSDSDQSPLRRRRRDSDSDQSPVRKGKHTNSSRTSKSSDAPKKATKTLGGAKAGLSSAAEMKTEAARLKGKEDRYFQNIDKVTLGKNAQTVVRDRSTGKRRNLEAEKAATEEEEKKKKEQEEKYKKWNQGLKQQRDRDAQLADQVHEADKPLARYQDDKDLDDMLRKQDRDEDPMLAFIKSKRKKEEVKSGKKKKELPRYNGPTAPPPNRFNIQPGYRWDGVDRSNGFEKKIFANIANKKAVQEMAYKWSTEDM